MPPRPARETRRLLRRRRAGVAPFDWHVCIKSGSGEEVRRAIKQRGDMTPRLATTLLECAVDHNPAAIPLLLAERGDPTPAIIWAIGWMRACAITEFAAAGAKVTPVPITLWMLRQLAWISPSRVPGGDQTLASLGFPSARTCDLLHSIRQSIRDQSAGVGTHARHRLFLAFYMYRRHSRRLPPELMVQVAVAVGGHAEAQLRALREADARWPDAH